MTVRAEIEVRGLVKCYGQLEAVRGIDLVVEPRSSDQTLPIPPESRDRARVRFVMLGIAVRNFAKRD